MEWSDIWKIILCAVGSAGGVGAIITGFTSVAANDFYFGGMMRLSDDALIPQYKKLVDIIHGVYHAQSEPIGFFGYSIASEEALKRRGFVQDEDFSLAVARRDTPVILYEENMPGGMEL